jgi:hypothetical protein
MLLAMHLFSLILDKTGMKVGGCSCTVARNVITCLLVEALAYVQNIFIFDSTAKCLVQQAVYGLHRLLLCKNVAPPPFFLHLTVVQICGCHFCLTAEEPCVHFCFVTLI